MPFSTTVRHSINLGGGLIMTVGDWSGAYGDAAGTIAVSGGYVVATLFFNMDNDNTTQIFPKVSLSTSGSVTTLTVQNQDAVTTGRFVIIHGGR